MSETDCRTCRNYREQPWDDFCHYKGHKIVFLDRKGCKGYDPKRTEKRGGRKAE